jgi:hypothetical protein
MIEQWQPIPGYNGVYEVSDHGGVRSARTGRQFSVRNPNKRYQHVRLVDPSGNDCYHLVHRIVAEVFVKPKFQVNHKDGNKHNNRADNLEWVTQIQNMRHASKLGLLVVPKGEARSDAKLTDAKVRDIMRLISEGQIPQYKIASMFGVSPMVISNIKHGISWRHVTQGLRAA